MNLQSNRKIPPIYFENLDALRFLAAFSVFIFHFFRDIRAFYPSLEGSKIFKAVTIVTDKGGLGVNFFFVLSGFLITYLILHERKHRGHFSLWRFLVRRTLRIWPLYFIIVLIGFVIFPLVFADYHTVHNPLNYVFFLANFDEIWYGAKDSINFLTSPWSVAVEEQFYLFWGIVLFLLFRFKFFKIEYLIILLYIGSFAFVWMYKEDPRVIYYHTFSVCQDILTGALIGVLMFRQSIVVDLIQRLPKVLVIATYILGIMLCIGKNKIFIGQGIVIERFFLSCFFAFVILDQVGGKNSFFKFGKVGIFNEFGKISYGFYLYHLVVMFLLVKLIEFYGVTGYQMIPTYFVLSFVFTIIISKLSYHFIESKFLNLKPK